MTTRERLLLGVDMGTSSCKATLLSGRRRVIAEATASIQTRRTASGEVSQDAGDWLRAVARTMRDVCSQVDASAVEAIEITAPAHYAVLVDRQMNPLGRVLLSSDGRPAATAQRLQAELGSHFFETTGVALTAGWTLPQLRWRLDADPALSKRLDMVLISKDYIRAVLTGQLGTDPSDAAGTAMYDLRSGSWAPELLGAAGISPGQVPPIQPSVSVAGGLSLAWARRTGIPVGAPVAVGATDTAAELVSVDATTPGSAIVKVASTGTVVVTTAAPRPDPRLLTYPHAVSGRWYAAAATSTAATSDTWWRRVMFAPGRKTVDRERARRLAARVAPGSDGLLFLPFLEGERSPRWDPRLRGAFLGVSSAHRDRHFYRAVLEGVAMSLRDCRDAMADAGLELDPPVLAGGGMRSALWRQIVVDVLGVPARHVPTQGPSIGAAILAGDAIGIRIRRGLVSGSPRGRLVLPDAERVERYHRVYAAYITAAAATAEVSHRLAGGPATG